MDSFCIIGRKKSGPLYVIRTMNYRAELRRYQQQDPQLRVMANILASPKSGATVDKWLRLILRRQHIEGQLYRVTLPRCAAAIHNAKSYAGVLDFPPQYQLAKLAQAEQLPGARGQKAVEELVYWADY